MTIATMLTIAMLMMMAMIMATMMNVDDGDVYARACTICIFIQQLEFYHMYVFGMIVYVVCMCFAFCDDAAKLGTVLLDNNGNLRGGGFRYCGCTQHERIMFCC